MSFRLRQVGSRSLPFFCGYFLVSFRFSEERTQQNRTVFQQLFGIFIESIWSFALHIDGADDLASVVQNRNDDLRTCAVERGKITRISAHLSNVHRSFLSNCAAG